HQAAPTSPVTGSGRLVLPSGSLTPAMLTAAPAAPPVYARRVVVRPDMKTGHLRRDDPFPQNMKLLQVLHDLAHQAGGLAQGLAPPDADLLQRFLLGLGGAGRAGDDGAGVAHGLALGRGEPGDVTDDRLGHVLLDVGRGPLLGVAADL